MTGIHESDEAGDAIDRILGKQSAFFRSGATIPRSFREEQLRSLLSVVEGKSRQIIDAVATDLRRSEFEIYAIEIGHVTSEIRLALKKLKSWMKPNRGLPPLLTAPSHAAVHYQPLGLNLIISTWNYPLQLALSPLVGAIAAGNVAVVKPSEVAPASSAILAEVIDEALDEQHVACIEGGIETSQALLARKWDHIFFTGGIEVGKIVARAAAENLSRITLELGGKSPAIVTDSADIPIAARRIALGKFPNAGQTCVAVDYVLAHESIREELVKRIAECIREFYGDDPRQSPDLARIVNERHFDRLTRLIDQDKVAVGGDTDRDERYIAPTVMTDVTLDDPVMSEEIFGPLLPIIEFDNLDNALNIIEQRPNPLALYLFTTNPSDEKVFIDNVSFGGGCINNTLLHFFDPNLPFGGIGQSGQGAYHGQYGFEAFSHRKSVLKTGNFLDPSLKYPPYGDKKLGLLKKLVR
jgi:aldehyde dehydrogenase (NAD+)